MRILLTNDDGFIAPGLIALYDAVKDFGEVHIAAPATVQSATSHAVTFHRPVKVEKKNNEHFEGYAVHGRPADCVKIAVEALHEKPFDLVISGVNAGANVGINVIYSGTVAAAREAAFMGIPAISISLHVKHLSQTKNLPWQEASKHAKAAIESVMNGPIKPHTVMNVNLPILEDGESPIGIKAAPICHAPMRTRYDVAVDQQGHNTYEVCSGMVFKHIEPESDVDLLKKKYITITPLHYQLTHESQLHSWEEHIKSNISSGVG